MTSYSLAQKRYRQGFAVIMFLYVIACFGGPILIGQFSEPPKWIAICVAVLTAMPIAGVFFLKWRYIKETDEYNRDLVSKRIVIASALTFSFCGLWGFLELFEVVPHLWTFLVVPMFFGCFGVATCFQSVFEKLEK